MRRRSIPALALSAILTIPSLSACSDRSAQAEAPADAQGASRSTAVPAGLARADFEVEGMTCGGCVIGTRSALRRLKGVRQADANYDDATGQGTAWALYDPTVVSPEQMMAAIRKLGYTPTSRRAL